VSFDIAIYSVRSTPQIAQNKKNCGAIFLVLRVGRIDVKF